MSVETGRDIPHDVYGGTLTEVGPSNMPSGGSPANLNVEFLPGLVRTRGGLQVEQSFSGISGGPYQVRYSKSYGQTPENQVDLVLLFNPASNTQLIGIGPSTVVGNVFGYGAALPWAPFATNPGFNGPFAQSSTQFGREYIAISEGRYGFDLPRQWDGTNFDRVSQCGPGQAPTAVDSVMTQAIAASPNGLGQYAGGAIAQIYEIGNTVWVLPVATNQGLATIAQPGDQIGIAGVSSDYNGTWPIKGFDASVGGFFFQHPKSGLSTISGTGTLTTSYVNVTLSSAVLGTPFVGGNLTIAGAGVSGYNGTWPVRAINTANGIMLPTDPCIISIASLGLSNSGGGTIKAPGSVSMGLHQLSVAFITRQRYITRPAPPSSFTASGSLKVDVSNIPIGPSNIIARLLIFTPILVPPAITGSFFSIRQTNNKFTTVMQINDNTSTTLSGVDFSDSDLLAGFNAEYLFGLVELGCCAGSFPYAERMHWWGELNMMQDFLNLEFNGGWDLGGGTGGSDEPLGWESDPVSGAGGFRFFNAGVWLDCYRVYGSLGVGKITQSAFQNFLGTPLLNPNTSYSARVTCRTSDNPGFSTVELAFSSLSVGGLGTVSVQPTSNTFQTLIGTFTGTTPAVIPSDAQLQLFAFARAGQTIDIDRIEIFPTNQAINYTAIRSSYPNDPESFDGVTGLIQPINSNGQAIRALYTLRDSMYIACDRSTFVIKDVPGTEPAFWTDDPVSSTIGTTNPNGVAAGEDWEVKVNRYGLYLYLGREPEKLSQEIQTLWNKQGYSSLINWQYGYKIWASVDLQNKRIYIGAPTGTSTDPNALFVMDYNTLDTSEMIAQYPTLRFSPYTGRRVILEQGRKWTIWQFNDSDGDQLPVPCGAFIEQSNGLAIFVLGGDADNNLYFIDPTNRGNDNGVGCTSSYTTHFFPTQDEEQGLELRSHMHGFSFARMYVSGNGVMEVNVFENTLSSATNPSNPKLTFNVNLSNPAPIDNEDTIDNFQAERFALQWTCSVLGSWFQMERLTRVVEQDPSGLIRGWNLQ